MIKELIAHALKAREMSYTPYSHFKVGAALLTADDKIVSGCNIESASYTPTNCAERTAFFKAVSEGIYSFKAIAVVGAPEGKDPAEQLDYCYPCGVCRQVMREFCDPKEFRIIIAKSTDDYREYLLEEILPHSFGPEHLKQS